MVDRLKVGLNLPLPEGFCVFIRSNYLLAVALLKVAIANITYFPKRKTAFT